MSASEEESVNLEFGGFNNLIAEDPDAEFEGEFGYALIKALRGKSVGRRMKRKLFKFGFLQLFCGFALLVITIEEGENFVNIDYVHNRTYGASLLELMWCISLPTFFFGFVTMIAVRCWASLTTNRRLLGNLLRIYMFAFFIIFIFTLWCCCVMFLTFIKVDDWGADVTTASLFSYYVATVIFIMPILTADLFFSLDLWHLLDEMEMGGNIAEPDPPDDVMDLSDVTICQTCIFVCAVPCVLCIQCSDLLGAIYRAYERHYRPSCSLARLCGSSDVDDKKLKKKRKRSVLRRVYKTIARWFTGASTKEVKPSAPPLSAQNIDLELADIKKDREEEERLERERLSREQEEIRHQQEIQEAALAAERKRQEEALLMEAAAKILAERKKREEEEAEEKKKEDENYFETTLSVASFKSLWSTLNTAGSFQCKLKTLPVLLTLTDHLKKQGFHIVFAATPSNNDIEIGVCNIRMQKSDTWFMARFLATATTFSAVMKAQNTELVTNYVKKFALAKVLKIDSGK